MVKSFFVIQKARGLAIQTSYLLLHARVGVKEAVENLLEVITELCLVLLGELRYQMGLLTSEIAQLLQVTHKVG